MLFQKDKFAEFTDSAVVDPGQATALTIAISAKSRTAVDLLADAAVSAGATPARDPQDYGFMYQRGFHDLDGYLWEVMWMDPE